MAIASKVAQSTTRKTLDLDKLEDLQSYAQTKGYKVEKNKPSLFRRTIDFISRPLYASAGAAKAVVKGENVLKEAYKGISGQEKETYSDVLGELGVQNKWIKGGVGFALDVALDPTTYFGGSLIKGASKVVGKGLGVAGKGFAKVAPESAEAFVQAGQKIKEGVGSAFSVYSGKTRDLVDSSFVQLNKLAKAKENVIDDIVGRFGKNVDPDKLERAGEYVYNNRLIERGIKKGEYKYPQDPQTRELVQSIKELGKLTGQKAGLSTNTLSLDRLSKAKNVLTTEAKTGGLERAISELKSGVSKPVRVRQLEDGSLFIEDGLHRILAAKKLGLKELPIEDVSKLYKGKKISGTADEWYFPGIDEIRLKPTGKESKVFGVGKEGYKKEFKGAIEEGRRVKDVKEAFGRRMFEVVRDNMNRQFLNDIVTQYGAKGIKAEEALAKGLVPIYEKSPLRFFKPDAESKLLSVAKSTPIGYLKKNDASFINNILFPEMKTIDTLAKVFKYDAFTNLFKTAVTAYFPAFHIRNALSGLVQNYQVLGARALAPANIMSGLAIMKKSDKVLKFKNWEGKASELRNILDDRFKGASRYISDIGDYIDELAGNNFKVKPISNARKLGNFIEMNQKAEALVTALRQGNTLNDALKLAEKAGFDYSKITNFESSVMKRLIPFYTFARKNAQLQAETLFKDPARIINQAKLANALSNVTGGKITEEDIRSLPKWALEGLGFKVSEGKYVSKLGLPLEEFVQRVNKPLMSTLSSLNPIIKFPLEAKMGYDFFREQKINDVNKIAPATGELFVKAKEKGILPDWLDNIFNVKKYDYKGKTYYSASPTALHAMRSIPTSRIEATLEKIFDKDMGKINKFMAFFTGGKIYDIDKEYQQYFTERDLRRDIEDFLMNKGIGSKFESYYIYK